MKTKYAETESALGRLAKGGPGRLQSLYGQAGNRTGYLTGQKRPVESAVDSRIRAGVCCADHRGSRLFARTA